MLVPDHTIDDRVLTPLPTIANPTVTQKLANTSSTANLMTDLCGIGPSSY